jgi:hypothetical protein
MVNLTASLKRIEFLITEFLGYWANTFIRELPAPRANCSRPPPSSTGLPRGQSRSAISTRACADG